MPLSLKSPNDGYNIQLLLTPTSDKLLPLSYLETLTKGQKLEPITWFDSRGVPLDYFDLMVKRVIIEHTVFVDSFIVRIGKNQDPVNLSNEIKFLQDVMNKPWFITLNNTVFEFTVKFYRYASFVPLMTYWWYNVLIEVTSNMTTESVRIVQEEEAFEIVQMKTTHQPGLKPFTLKKTNFCNRVRLDRSEWLAGFQEIRLNTSEAVLDSNKTLGDSEFDIFLGEQGEPTVEICVEDFNPNYHEQVARGMANVLF